MSELVDELTGLLAGPVQRRETHGAWVLLSGDHAYKLRKPVRLPYLDYSTVALRLACGRAEVALNARLAPGIYLGVRALVRDGDALALGPWEETADAVDYVVVMRRFDEAATMAAHARAGTLYADDVDAVARVIATFHAQASPVAETDGGARLRERIHADLDDLAQLRPPGLDVTALRAFATAALRRHARELDERARAGRWRDGHGDLRAEHVVLGDPIAIVDRVEFDAALRHIDVASDLAFLAMDLESLGARWAAQRLIDDYANAGGHPAGPALQALLAWQRAIVRLKIAVLRDDAAAAGALGELADALAWRERACPVLLICGPPASGKSTLATAVAARCGLPVVSTDPIRKELHGVRPTDTLPPSAYSREATLRVYHEVGRRAADAVDAGGGAIIDATAGDPGARAALQAGLGGRGPVRVICCRADHQTLARRATARLSDPARVSDAGPDVALALAEAFDAPRSGDDGIAGVVDVDTSVADVLEAAARALDGALS